MNALSACEIIARARGEAVIVATMGAMLAFDRLGVEDGRINSVPLMGGAGSLGLGIALAQPRRKVIVVDGDSSLLMQLGGLVGIAGQRPLNLYHFVIHNGVQFAGMYNLAIPGNGRADFVGLARSAGYATASRFSDDQSFSQAAAGILAGNGPAFIDLCVEPEPTTFGVANPQAEVPDRQFTRMAQEAHRLGAWLQT